MKNIFKRSFRTLLPFLLLCALYIEHANAQNPLYQLIGDHYGTVKLSKFVNPFSGAKNSIANISKQIEGLEAVKLPLTNGLVETGSLKFKTSKSCDLLIGIFRDSAAVLKSSSLKAIDFGSGELNNTPVIKNAMSLTGLPAIDVYAVRYKKGIQHLKWTRNLFMVLGAVSSVANFAGQDAGCPDGRLWEPFYIDGFTSEKALFEIVGGLDKPVLDEGMEGTQDIRADLKVAFALKLLVFTICFLPNVREKREWTILMIALKQG